MGDRNFDAARKSYAKSWRTRARKSKTGDTTAGFDHPLRSNRDRKRIGDGRLTSRRLSHEALERRELLAAEVMAEAHAIFAVGSSEDQIRTAHEQLGAQTGAGDGLFSPIIPDASRRWVNTALGNSPNVGDVSSITWSIVPDGTQILDSNTGAVDGTSDLVAFMDGIYGGSETSVIGNKPWFTFFEQAYQHWSDVSGLTMVYEPNDDGVPTTGGGSGGAGVLGVRGDMRIAGRDIDGNSGVLAFNFFPNNRGLDGSDGDMVIDTNDNFYANNSDGPNGENLALFNVLTHEIGHGIGLSHVEPVNQTKLMEPFVSTAFRGPQEDDIWNSHILYGDHLEPSDTFADAIDFGSLRNEVRSVSGASIDNGATGDPLRDIDLYRFEILTPTAVSVDLTPTGTQYDEAPQGGESSPVDRLRESDLGFRVLDVDGNELLAINDVGLGIGESVEEFDLDDPGVYFLEVFGSDADPQLYDLSFRIGRTFDFGRNDGDLRLLGVNPSPDEVFGRDDLNLLDSSPSELVLRFSGDQPIDEDTLDGGIRVSEAGRDGVLGTPDDVLISPGFLGLTDPSGRVVTLRFAESLDDGRYRLEVFGENDEDVDAVRKVDGEAFQPFENGSDRDTIDFELELGARVTAVVPQPISRDAAGNLNQATDVVHVYFDDDDLFAGGGTTSLVDPNFYQLIRTGDTATNNDDTAVVPVNVVAVPFETQRVPSPVEPGTMVDVQVRVNRVELTFAEPLDTLPGQGTFRLKIGSSEPVATREAPSEINQVAIPAEPAGTADAALSLGSFDGASTLRLSESIVDTGLPFDYPGANDEPGHREISEQVHLNAGTDTTADLQTRFYNFALDRPYGLDSAGQPLFTSMNPEQRQRIREVFEIYGQQFGVNFVETRAAGTTVVLGDLFPNGANSGPGGIIGVAGPALAILDSAENWYDGYGRDPSGISFFETALHELGHSIGLGHNYELPGGTIMGSETTYAGQPTEWRYPGDHDVVHGQHIYRPDNRDVDMYRFEVTVPGRLSAETFAERRQGGSLLDTSLVLFRSTADGIERVAGNDDMFGDDSAIELALEEGTYFVAVTAQGNENFNPELAGSGSGATSQGDYDLLVNFTPAETSSILDAAGMPIDGDADGVAGGSFDFWFKAVSQADVLFVDASADVGGDGSLATPYREIRDAVSAAQPGQIVRIVGNAGADQVVGLPNDNFAGADDNLSYEIGRIDSLNQDLSDGRNLIIPKDVTVMIDAGAVFKMLGSRIAVGSGSSGVDNSGAALQVLGTPHLPVFFTSYNDPGAGLEQNTLNSRPRAGDWGGIDIRNQSDRGEGRVDAERQGSFVNYVAQTDIRYGGGVVRIDGQLTPIAPIRLDAARPTLIGNRITRGSDAAISADPASFEETTFTDLRYQRDGAFVPDYRRVGPVMYDNHLTTNSINGVLIRIDTPPGGQPERLTVPGRFDDTEVVHVLGDTLQIQGNPGGPLAARRPEPPTVVTLAPAASDSGLPAGDYVYRISYIDVYGVETEASAPTGMVSVDEGQAVRLGGLPIAPEGFTARRLYRAPAGSADFRLVADLNRTSPAHLDSVNDTTGEVAPVQNPVNAYRTKPDARLVVDAGVVIKSSRVRIETGMGADLIAEGDADSPVIFTSRTDDRYGAGGTFDTLGDGQSPTVPGEWAGIFVNPFGRLSLDHAVVGFAGGSSEVGGVNAGFNAVGILQAEARITNTTFEGNASGVVAGDGNRVGRGPNEAAVIHIVAAQPIIGDNTFLQTTGNDTAAISINVNSLVDRPINDQGQQTGFSDPLDSPPGNFGPLVHGNRMQAGGIAGLRIRPEVLTTAVVFDDTDIAHVVTGQIIVPNVHTYGGLRLQSRGDESLVVKFANDASLIADGRPLDINDRIGGAIQIIGAPGFPVVLTDLADDSVGAGFDPFGAYFTDTNGGGVSSGSPGAWRGIELGEFSNDRNVETVVELEGELGGEGDENGDAGTAQTLGQLARAEKASDENLRLGYSIHGTIASPGDADVYSFRGTAGTTVWLDIDLTDASLDSVVELIDGDGQVLARSDNSHAESAAGVIPGGGLAMSMRQSAFGLLNAINGSYQDLYTLNPLDAGMRLELPGSAGTQREYFVRVTGRQESTGSYQLQVRLNEADEFAGSTVRYADIRFASVGIRTRGLPSHSPLLGEGSSDGNSVVDLGNIANTDRAVISVSGNLANESSANRYAFRVERDSVQGAGDTVSISATFDIDYADGAGRPDTTLLLYYRGNDGGDPATLVMMAEDSNIASDQPGPGQSADIDDLSRGSLGTRDAFLGTVELPAGEYDLVVVAKSQVPAGLDQYFVASPNNPNFRLEPSTSVVRIASDRFGDDEIENLTLFHDPPQDVVFQGENNAVPYTLGDVSLFLAVEGRPSGNSPTSRLVGINPQIGDIEAISGPDFTQIGAIAMRPDGFLFAAASPPNNAIDTDANTGDFLQLNDVDGSTSVVGNAGIVTFDTYDTNPDDNDPTPDIAVAFSDGGPNGDGVSFEALTYHVRGGTDNELRFYGVASRGNSTATFERALLNVDGDVIGTTTIPATNYLYRLDPQTGAVINARTVGDTSDRNADERTEGAGTNKIEIGRIEIPGVNIGLVTGIASLGNSVYAITNLGHLIQVGNPSDNGGVRTGDSPSLGTLIGQVAGGSISFTAMTAGPRNIPGVSDLLFATDSSGNVHAINTSGQLVDVLGFGQSDVDTGQSGVSGLAFSTLDVNLWHRTEKRGNEAGHGTPASVDGSRESVAGQNSLYFGFDQDNNVADDSQSGQWRNEYSPQRSVDSYDFPGGAQGQVESYGIDLTGYDPEDQPVLYFNYLLDVEDENAIRDENGQARDSFRVYVNSHGDREWTLVATNNTAMEQGDQAVPHDVGDNDYTDRNDEFDIRESGFVDRAGQYQVVQPLFNTTQWRQARITLSPWAGHEDVRIRFDFNTAGEPEVNALELRAGTPRQVLDSGESVFELQYKDDAPAQFQFDFGDVLDLPGGTAITHGATIDVTDRASGAVTTFTFLNSAIDASTGPLIVSFDAAMTGADVKGAFAAKLVGFDVVEDPSISNRLSIKSSRAVTVSGLPSGVVVSRAVSDPRAIQMVDVRLDMNAAEVRDAMHVAIANRMQRGVADIPDPATANLAPFQDFNDSLRLFGFNATEPGPLSAFGGYSDRGTIDLPGSAYGVYGVSSEDGFGNNSTEALRVAADRGLNNAGGGVFVDDVIVGFAERGEMVLTDVFDTALIDNELFELKVVGDDERIDEIAAGDYQLEIRLSAEYGEPIEADALSESVGFEEQDLFSAYDTNLPHAEVIALRFVDQVFDGNGGLVAENPINGGDIADGSTIRLSDGVREVTLEFNDVGNPATSTPVASGRVPVPFNAGMTETEVAAAVRDAINSAEVQAFLDIRASSLSGESRVGVISGDAVLLHGSAAADRFGSLQFTNAAELPIQVAQYGRQFLPQALDQHGSSTFPFYVSAPFTGDANRFRPQGQVILQGNVITDSGSFGIAMEAGRRDRATDDVADLASTELPRPGTPRSFIANNPNDLVTGVVAINNVLAGNRGGGILVDGDSTGPVPAASSFARVVNNTVFGRNSGDAGIRVAGGASPTLLGNAVVNLATGIDLATPVGAVAVFDTLYAGNGTNSSGTLGATPLFGEVDELFVDPDVGNFYPLAGSLLIDSARGSVSERESLLSLRQSLGIALSPILAPPIDITGQTRVDDPDVTGPGTGTTVFTDRGAYDRSDFRGPTASLNVPLDNDAQGRDTDSSETFVRLREGTFDQFVIQLDEFKGTGTDDLSVSESSLVISENGRRLIPDVDYVFGYSTTSNTIIVTPTSGVWSQDSAFEITLNNRDRIAAQMSNGLGVIDGDQFEIIDDADNSVIFEYDHGVVLSVDDVVNDGDRIRYRRGLVTVQVEFDDDGVIEPSSSQVIDLSATDTADDLAAKIASAFAATELGLSGALAVEDGRVYLGGRPDDSVEILSAGLSQVGSPGVSDGVIAVPFVPTAAFTADTMAGQVIAAIASSGLNTSVFAPGGGVIYLDQTDFVIGLESGDIRAIRDLAGNELAPNRANRETQFTIVMPNVQLDFGDAPSRSDGANQYLTRLAENGPRHTISSEQLPRLGNLVDTETDARVGNGDDAVATIAASGSGAFSVTELSPSEVVVDIDDMPSAGDTLSFSIDGTDLDVRLVLAGTTGGGGIDVLSVPGEPASVLAERIVSRLRSELRDAAPEVSVLHTRETPTFRLVSLDDEEGMKIGSVDVGGERIDGVFFNPDSGELLSFLNPLASEGSELIVQTTGGGLLDGWVDFNGDGDFTDPGEQVLRNQPVLDGSNTVTIRTPSATVAGNGVGRTWSRFRLSGAGNLLPSGVAIGGEVEDHAVLIAAVSLPTPADDTYTTDEDVTLAADTGQGVGRNDSVAGTLTDVQYELEQTTVNGTLNFDADTGTFTYSPDEDFFGEDVFSYRLTAMTTVDGVQLPLRSGTSGVVRITVNPVNDDPFAAEQDFATVEPTEASPTVALTITSAELLEGALPQVDAAERFAPWDEREQALRVVQIIVNDASATPVTVVDMSDAVTPVDGSYFAESFVGGMLSGTLTVNVDGGEVTDVVYAPAANYNEDNPQFGSIPTLDGFTYTVADDGATTLPDGTPAPGNPQPKTASAVANIRVTAQNDPPTAVDDFLDAAVLGIGEDTTVTIPASAVLANDFAGPSPDDDESLAINGNDGALRLATNRDSGLPSEFVPYPRTTTAGGRVDLNADGDLVYTPPENYFGPDSFEYFVVDSGIDRDVNDTTTNNVKFGSATVAFEIQAVNDPPITTDKFFVTLEDQPLVISAAQFLEGSLPSEHTDLPDPLNENEQSLRIIALTALGETLDASNAGLGELTTPWGTVTANFDSQGALLSATYTPATDFNSDNPLTDGSRTRDSFSFVVSDDGLVTLPGGGTATTDEATVVGNVSVLVTPQNDPAATGDDFIGIDSPTWNDFFASAPVPTEDTPLTIPLAFLTANDFVGPATAGDERMRTGGNDGTLSVVPGTYTTSLGGTVVVDLSSAVYTPPADVYGDDVFTYTVVDQGVDETVDGVRNAVPLQADGTATIHLEPVNDPPVGRDRNLMPIESGEIGGIVTFDFTADELLFGGPGTDDDAFAGPDNPGLGEPHNEPGQTLRVLEIRTSPFQVANRDTLPSGSDSMTLTTSQGGTLIVNFEGDAFVSGTYTPPNGDFNSLSPFPLADTFRYIVADDGFTVDAGGGPDFFLPAAVSELQLGGFAIQPTNDAPTFNFMQQVTIDERDDGDATTIPAWATNIRPGPTTALDESRRQTVSFLWSEADSTVPQNFFAQPPTVSPTGALSIFMAPDAIGSATLVFDAVDADDSDPDFASKSTRATFQLTVQGVNDQPVFDPGDAITVLEDSGAFSASWATGISPGPQDEVDAGQTVSFTVNVPTSASSLFADPPAIDDSGNLTFAVADDVVGVANVTVRAVDSAGGISDPAELRITIVEQPDPPSAIDDLIVTTEDAVLVIEPDDLLANDVDADLLTDPNESLSLFAPPSFTTAVGAVVTFDASTGEFTYDPTVSDTIQELSVGQSLTDSFDYEIEDADGESPRPSATVTLQINGLNDAPRVRDDSVAFDPSGETLIRPLDNDVDIDGTVDPTTIVITSEPRFGFVTIVGDGTLTYTPDPGSTAADSFRYTVADNAGQQSAQATVRVGEGPLGIDVQAGTALNRPVNIDVASAITGGAALDLSSITIIDQPDNGTLVIGADGVLTFTPTQDFVGNDSFTFTVADVNGLVSNPTMVNLRVVRSGLQNPLLASDVNGDGQVTAFDALLIINRLNRADSGSVPVEPDDQGPSFYDQNGNMEVTAQDALLVINDLNRQSTRSAFGEGEAMGLPAVPRPRDLDDATRPITTEEGDSVISAAIGSEKVVGTSANESSPLDVIVDQLAAEDDESSLATAADRVDAAMAELM